MSVFTASLPTIVQYFRHGQDRTGIVTGAVQGKDGPGIVVETLTGGSIELRYMHDAFTIFKPLHDQWPHLMHQHMRDAEAAA